MKAGEEIREQPLLNDDGRTHLIGLSQAEQQLREPVMSDVHQGLEVTYRFQG